MKISKHDYAAEPWNYDMKQAPRNGDYILILIEGNHRQVFYATWIEYDGIWTDGHFNIPDRDVKAFARVVKPRMIE